MRIALFTDGLFPEFIGGMQKHSLLMILNLVKEGAKLDVYHPGSKIPEEIQLLSPDLRKNVNLINVPFPTSFHFPGHYLWNSYRYSKRILKAFIKEKSNVEFVYAQGFSGWAYIKIKKSTMPPIGINFHGMEMFQKIKGRNIKMQQNLLKPFARALVKKADVIFSLGGKLTQLIKDLNPNGKLIKIPIGVDSHWLIDENEIKTKSEILKVLFVGRNEWRKGLHLLNNVIQRFDNEKVGGIEFGFVGNISDKLQTSNLYCIYFGEISEETKLKKIFQEYDVLVCPSLAEGMPTVILEAMANGLAIVATDTGATAELVNIDNGLLIEAGNINELEQALIKIKETDIAALAHKKVSSLDKVKKSFLWPQVAKKTLLEISKFLRSND